MEYRSLSRAEIGLVEQIDRTESVDGIYSVRDGALVLTAEHWDIPEWSPAAKARRVAELQALYDRGATCYGAFDGPRLVAMSVLDHNPMVSDARRRELAGLWVSQAYRGQGVGRTLVQLVQEEARALGAATLYLTATPSLNTVRFYQSLGFHLADPLDPAALEREPDDIHMEMTL